MANSPFKHPNIPSVEQPIADGEGRITTAWYQFLQALNGVGSAQAAATITLGGSPFTYTAPASGTVFINGGMTSHIAIQRGTSGKANTVTSTFALAEMSIPVVQGDLVTVTYSILPNMSFFPS